jgi:hypothetical protein
MAKIGLINNTTYKSPLIFCNVYHQTTEATMPKPSYTPSRDHRLTTTSDLPSA